MIYVYRSSNSTGALELSRALNGRRIKAVPVLKAEDVLICWGSYYNNIPREVKTLNNVPLGNKFEDALKLKQAGVATIEVSRLKPIAGRERVEVPAFIPVVNNVQALFNASMEMANDYVENENPNFNSPVFIKGVNDFKDSLINLAGALDKAPVRAIPANPIRVAPIANEVWIGRVDNHKGGMDLLNPPRNPDYFVRKEDIVEEYRVHSFREKSIRAGKKAHRDGFANPSPWIRSWDGGWAIKYEGVKGDKDMRLLAHAAVKALGLDFGAVDIGKLRNGKLIVLEVNRAPGIEGGTIIKYKEAIERWLRGE